MKKETIKSITSKRADAAEKFSRKLGGKTEIGMLDVNEMLAYTRSLSSKKVLLVLPPKLLAEFQKICAEDSYALVEGIREAMRRMIWERRETEYQSPEDEKNTLQATVEFFKNFKEIYHSRRKKF